eukprot:27818-Eustigmatos_ZCMA.PRE.1
MRSSSASGLCPICATVGPAAYRSTLELGILPSLSASMVCLCSSSSSAAHHTHITSRCVACGGSDGLLHVLC